MTVHNLRGLETFVAVSQVGIVCISLGTDHSCGCIRTMSSNVIIQTNSKIALNLHYLIHYNNLVVGN